MGRTGACRTDPSISLAPRVDVAAHACVYGFSFNASLEPYRQESGSAPSTKEVRHHFRHLKDGSATRTAQRGVLISGQ